MYTFDSRIRYSETDSEGRLTLTSLLNYFQDCSTFHAEDIGSGISFMREKKMVWVLNSWQIVVSRFPMMGERVKIGTLPHEFRKFIGQRNFVMMDEKGEYLAKANSIWSLISSETGKPVSATEELLQGYQVEEKLDMEYADRKIPLKEGGVYHESIPVTMHYLDTNHHVNNGQYVALAAGFLPENCTVCQLRAEYKKQAFLGDVMRPYVVTEEDLYTIAFQDMEGKTYAAVEFKLGRN